MIKMLVSCGKLRAGSYYRIVDIGPDWVFAGGLYIPLDFVADADCHWLSPGY